MYSYRVSWVLFIIKRNNGIIGRNGSFIVYKLGTLIQYDELFALFQGRGLITYGYARVFRVFMIIC
jgi:hypothetical protein